MHKLDSTDEQHLLALADYVVKKSVWIVGGDGLQVPVENFLRMETASTSS
jgi:hypothetical protein